MGKNEEMEGGEMRTSRGCTVPGPFAGEGTDCLRQKEMSQSIHSSCKIRKSKLRLKEGKGLPQGHPASDRSQGQSWALAASGLFEALARLSLSANLSSAPCSAACCCWHTGSWGPGLGLFGSALAFFQIVWSLLTCLSAFLVVKRGIALHCGCECAWYTECLSERVSF